jgi:CHASE3 domain sensor protein
VPEQVIAGKIVKGLSEKIAASGFVVALVLLGGVGTSSYLSMQKVIENKQGIIHNYDVLEALKNTFEGVIDAESGRRGYLLAGKKFT